MQQVNLIKIGSKIGEFWMRWYRLVFFLFLFGACGLGGYIWYKSLYASNWSESRKNEYSQTLRKEVVFNEKDFNWLLERNKDKMNVLQNTVTEIRDVFKLNQLGQ